MAKFIDNIFWKYNSFIAKIAKKIIKGLNKYNDYVMSDKVYRLARLITKPIHWLWIFGWFLKLKASYKSDPFSEPGLYIITAPPGGGKSSLAYELMERAKRKNGKGSYINTAIERPRIDYNKMFYYSYHQRYKISDFFKDNDIVAYPNHLLFNQLHIDEAHLLWNYRNAMTKDYKDTFIPFMEYAVGVRHYIGHIFMYTQLSKVDTQAESLANGNLYQVRIKKGFDYKRWLIDGVFKLTIKGWYIDKVVKYGDKVKTIGSWYYDRTFDIDYFETFNLRKELNYSKLHQPRGIN